MEDDGTNEERVWEEIKSTINILNPKEPDSNSNTSSIFLMFKNMKPGDTIRRTSTGWMLVSENSCWVWRGKTVLELANNYISL